ncbi:MAG TPA: diaminopimelate epimerase [Terracidiphilus sp.]|nr:diaminopimelate epimerase [Terracidiphilus sp.]
MIPFAKAHACGNDFLIITEDDAADFDKTELTRQLCARNTGIGADGIEFFSWTGEHSGRIRLYNADGSVAEISGNGTRCVAAWMASERDAHSGDQLSIETDAGTRVSTIQAFRHSEISGPTVLVTTDMGVPEFAEHSVELSDGTRIDGIRVSMGNPHFVIVQPDGDFDRSWEEIGEEICLHPDFPDQTNVEFVHALGSQSEPIRMIGIRIFERGVGPTSSSGTGTSAAATAMIGVYQAASELEVIAPGGTQTVRWEGPGEKLYLTGPATLVARGEAWTGEALEGDVG